MVHYFTSKSVEVLSKNALLIFDNQINWNSGLVWIQRICSISLSFLLFKNLSSHHFSLFSNGMALIFLILLWIDGGFRKAIPRYAFDFLKNSSFNKKFLKSIVTLQIFLLLACAPLLYYFLSKFAVRSINLLGFFLFFFFIEGILNLIRLLYNSYFLYKPLVAFTSLAFIIEFLIIGLYIFFKEDLSALLFFLLFTKIFISFSLLVFLSFYFFIFLSSCPPVIENKNSSEVPPTPLLINFFKHSFIMWLFVVLKSLTERNFLVPLFTYVCGPIWANNFKIIQDSAIFLQRLILKTIGTADTSFFTLISYHSAGSNNLGNTLRAVRHMIKKVFHLILLSVIVYIFFYFIEKKYLLSSSSNISFFIALASFLYLLELIFVPYERFLEVNFHYKTLFKCYLPYLVGLSSLALFYWVTKGKIFLDSPYTIPALFLIVMSLRLSTLALIALAAQAKITSSP